MNFNETLKLHLNYMKDKELDKFVSTVRLDNITVIMPNGTIIKNSAEFIELHKNWFLDTDWELDFKILKTEESAEMAYALVAVDYKDCDNKGNPIYMNYYLNLVFTKHGETWLLVHDQNTIYHNDLK